MSNIRVNEYPSRQQYTYAGGARTFVIDFPFFEDADIYVYVGDPADNFEQEDPNNLLVQNTDYTLTGAGLATGGVVTIDAAFDLTVGDTVTIVGRMVIDRYSIYDTSSVISKAQLNEDFNRVTVMIQNINTIIEQTMPKYDRSEVINTVRDATTPFSYVNLPLLEAGEFWVGNETSTGISKNALPTGYIVTADHVGMQASIAVWTGTDFVLTDSTLNLAGNVFSPLTATDSPSFTGASLGLPTGATDDRPAAPTNGQQRYNTTSGVMEYYGNGAWRNFVTATGAVQDISIPQFTGNSDEIEPTAIYIDGTDFTPVTATDIVGIAGDAFGLPSGTTAERPAAPANGYIRYNTDDDVVEAYVNGMWVALTAQDADGGAVVHTITQAGHGFSVGDVVRMTTTATTYTEAQADSSSNAEAIGIVVGVSGDDFTLQQSGYFDGFVGLTAGSVYFLSPTVAGAVTVTEPSTAGQISKPLIIAESATTGWILSYRGNVVGSPSSGSGSGEFNGSTLHTVTQASHGFSVGEAIYIVNPTGVYTLADASAEASSQSVGIVNEVIDANNFVVQWGGYIGTGIYSGMTPGDLFYLSDSTAGALTTTEPTTAGSYSKLMVIAESSTTGWLMEQSAKVVGPDGTDPVTKTVTQAGHGFTGGEWLKISASNTYALAQADSVANAAVIGMVTEVPDVNTFVIQQIGYTDASSLSGTLTAATQYYLSSTVAGAMTTTAPTTAGTVSKELFFSLNTNEGWIQEHLGVVNTGSGGVIQTQYSLVRDRHVSGSSLGSFGTISGIDVTITPTSASNKVLLNINLSYSTASGLSIDGIIYRLARNGTPITEALGDNSGVATIIPCTSGGVSNKTATWHLDTLSFTFIDEPASTSALTYTVEMRSQTNTGGAITFILNRTQTGGSATGPIGVSTMIAQEIA